MQFRLPWAPSTNRIWRTGPHGTYLSPEYKTFLRESQLAWYEQGRPRVRGELTVHLYLFPPDSRPRDVDNRIKPALDAMTKIGFWEDDRVVKKISATLCEPVERGAIVVEVFQFEKEELKGPEKFGLKRKEPKNDRRNARRNPTKGSDWRYHGIRNRRRQSVSNAALRVPPVTRRGQLDAG